MFISVKIGGDFSRDLLFNIIMRPGNIVDVATDDHCDQELTAGRGVSCSTKGTYLMIIVERQKKTS